MPTSTGATPRTAKKNGARKPLPGPNSDFYQLVDVLTAEELALVKKVRTYMETKVAPIIDKYWSEDAFPFELLPSFKNWALGASDLRATVAQAEAKSCLALLRWSWPACQRDRVPMHDGAPGANG